MNGEELNRPASEMEEEETANETLCGSVREEIDDEEEEEDQQQTKLPAVVAEDSSTRRLEIPEGSNGSAVEHLEKTESVCSKNIVSESADQKKKPLPRIIRQREDELTVRSDFPDLEESKMEEIGDIPGFSLIQKEDMFVDGAPATIDQAPASMSTLTSTTSNAQQQQQTLLEEQHLEREYAHSPPAIPRPAAFASSSIASEGTRRGGGGPSSSSAFHNKSEYVAAVSGRLHKSGGPGLPLPDYKAQVTSRSFLRINESDLLVDGVPENGSTSQSAAAAVAAQDETEAAVSATAAQQEPIRVVAQHVVTTPSARQTSSGSGESQQHQQQDDADIPVVPAILVPQERLDAEHRHRSDGQQSGTTESNTDSSVGTHANNNNNNNRSNNNRSESNGRSHSSRSKSRSDAASNENAPPGERQFWVTLIIAAMALNSILVTGVVVASFCAAGKCTPSSSSANEDFVPTPSLSPPPTLAPSVQPAGNRLLSAMPTDSIFGDSPSETSGYPPPPIPAPIAAGTATPAPTAVLSELPEGDNAGGNSNESNPENPENGASAEQDKGTKSSSSGLPLVVIEILLALATEVVILGGLYLYYRRWKRQRKVHEESQRRSAAGGDGVSITSSCSNLNHPNDDNHGEESSRLVDNEGSTLFEP